VCLLVQVGETENEMKNEGGEPTPSGTDFVFVCSCVRVFVCSCVRVFVCSCVSPVPCVDFHFESSSNSSGPAVAQWANLAADFKDELGETTLEEFQALEKTEVDEFLGKVPMAKKGKFRKLYKLKSSASGQPCLALPCLA
jgi:hypothetical protein